jgi:hypothetical protein
MLAAKLFLTGFAVLAENLLKLLVFHANLSAGRRVSVQKAGYDNIRRRLDSLAE